MSTGRVKVRGKPSKAAWRLHWLFMEMLQERTPDDLPRFASQAAMASWLGLSKQFVNQIVNLQTSGVQTITDVIIDHLMHRVGLLPDWFFGEWADDEDRPSYKDYLASTKRIARTVQTLQQQRTADRQMLDEVLARLAELEAERAGTRPIVTGKRKR